MKKVLVIAYNYPPSNIVGAVRPSKFVRYLPKFGWEPTVLTVALPSPVQDSAGNSTADIHHVREWPHPLKAYYCFMEQRAKKKGQGDEFITQMNPPHAAAMSPPKRGVAGLKHLFLNLMRLPDQEMGWLVPTILKGVWLIRRKTITHLITTGPPYTSHLIGLALKRLTGVRWVADFRDPWSVSIKYTLTRDRITDAMESRVIRSVMELADVVLSVTPPMTEQLRMEHRDLDPDKFMTLTNGFDPAEFIGLTHSRPTSGPIIFSYLGEFYYGRTPEPFLRAVKSLLDEGALKTGDVRIQFVGNVAFAEGRSVVEMVRSLGLEEIVTVEPHRVSRREALQRAFESHVLLVLTEQHSYALTFKLFDALAVGATIFNIGSKGAVADILEKTGRGIAVDHNNAAEIRYGILECIRRSRSEETQRNLEPWADAKLQAYDFQNLTGRLAELLEGHNPIKVCGMDGHRIH